MSYEPAPTPGRIPRLLDDLMARDRIDEKISFGRLSEKYVEAWLASATLDRAIQIQSEYAKSVYEGFVAQATKIGELYANLAKEAFKPVESVLAEVQAAAAHGSGIDSSDDKSVDERAMLDAAAQSLARSAELLTKAADERGKVAAELAARERRIDRVQEETKVLLDALVAGHD